MIKTLKIKVDNRFKDGNIKKVGDTYWGNSKTLKIQKMQLQALNNIILKNIPLDMQQTMIKYSLNPLIVVSPGVEDAFRRELL